MASERRREISLLVPGAEWPLCDQSPSTCDIEQNGENAVCARGCASPLVPPLCHATEASLPPLMM